MVVAAIGHVNIFFCFTLISFYFILILTLIFLCFNLSFVLFLFHFNFNSFLFIKCMYLFKKIKKNNWQPSATTVVFVLCNIV